MLVTHDLPVVAQVCDRAAVMYAGEIVEAGRLDDLFHEPKHPYTRMLFAATPDLYGEDEVLSIPGAPPRLDRDIAGCPFRERCDRAFERCLAERPLLKPVGEDRVAACHLNDEPVGGRGAERPMSAEARTTGGPALEVRDLVTRYPIRRGLFGTIRREPRQAVHAVEGVSLTLRTGEMLALVGESGCGKTTVAQSIVRLVDPVVRHDRARRAAADRPEPARACVRSGARCR